MGKHGIIAEHPTLKLKYLDPEMGTLALELKEKLDTSRAKDHEWKVIDYTHWEGDSDGLDTSTAEVKAADQTTE